MERDTPFAYVVTGLVNVFIYKLAIDAYNTDHLIAGTFLLLIGVSITILFILTLIYALKKLAVHKVSTCPHTNTTTFRSEMMNSGRPRTKIVCDDCNCTIYDKID